MQVNIYSVTSPIHNVQVIERQTTEFLSVISEAISRIDGGREIDIRFKADNYEDYGHHELSLIFIRTGGTENIFRELLNLHSEIGQKHIYLLASGNNNSLAASVEILSYLRKNGMNGEIIHGGADYIANRIYTLSMVEAARRELRGKRVGVIGKPSDWLISSNYDTERIKQLLGIEIVDISMDETIKEIKKRDYPIEARRRVNTCPSDFFVGALEIYGALKRLIEKYKLNGLTIRCFDLLTAVKNTGCLALALLNQEGIPSSCEGDVPALLTMMISQTLFGETGFQANPSRMNPESGEIVFAHCTVPFNMVTDYKYDTHFESGIGVGIKGELQLGKATIAKVSGDLSRYYVENVILTDNLNEKDLCRTQIVLKTVKAIPYLLHEPIGNHHIILRGHEADMFSAFMESL